MSGAPQQQQQQQYTYAPTYGAAGYVPAYGYNQQQQGGGGDYSADNNNNGQQQQMQQQGYAPQGYAMAPAQGYAYPQQQSQYPQQAYQQQQGGYQQQMPNNTNNGGYNQQQQQQQQQAPNTNTGYTHSPYNNDGRRQSSSMSNSSRSHHSHDGHGHSMSSASSANDSGSDAGGAQQRAPANVTLDNVHEHVGRIVTTATGSHGSSFLQAALRQYPIEAFEIVYKEIAPVMGKLLLDKHACYVVKMVLEMMDKDEAIGHLQALSSNEELLCTLCTKDLHSRRMIQFILDFSGPDRCRYLFDLVMRRPMQIVRTQQGCITLQRILDHFSIQEKETYFATVRAAFMDYALDPFGNYIIQYMLAEGNQVENSNTLAMYCRGQLHNMICHKYASNVIEKCFGLVTPELQHDVIEEMFNAPQEALMRILTDASANYVVQAAIRAASYRDVQMINQRISPLLPSIPYGKKIQQRLNRRLNHNN